jgi:hypothetical protein
MKQTDFSGSQFPDGKGRDGSGKVGLLIVKLFNTGGSPRTFYPV